MNYVSVLSAYRGNLKISVCSIEQVMSRYLLHVVFSVLYIVVVMYVVPFTVFSKCCDLALYVYWVIAVLLYLLYVGMYLRFVR